MGVTAVSYTHLDVYKRQHTHTIAGKHNLECYQMFHYEILFFVFALNYQVKVLLRIFQNQLAQAYCVSPVRK